MFLKMIWLGQHFERTDSEHNFILLSERFNLKRVTLSVQVIASTEPPIGSRNLPNSAVMVSARRQMLKSMRNPETGYPQARTATIVGTLLVQSLLFLMSGHASSQSSEPAPGADITMAALSSPANSTTAAPTAITLS